MKYRDLKLKYIFRRLEKKLQNPFLLNLFYIYRISRRPSGKWYSLRRYFHCIVLNFSAKVQLGHRYVQSALKRKHRTPLPIAFFASTQSSFSSALAIKPQLKFLTRLTRFNNVLVPELPIPWSWLFSGWLNRPCSQTV